MTQATAGQPVRRLSEIGFEIQREWPDPYFGAVPYIEALQYLGRIDDWYGADSAESIVVYFLANATGWRGEKAREIKAELRRMAGLK